jgi:branched-chain amino acid transport system ATP-binding protein
MARTILALKSEGLTILISEQNLHFVAYIADKATVIEKGRIRYSGTMAELRNNTAVQQEYLIA